MAWRKKDEEMRYDPERQEPAVRKSICSGEMTAGIVDKDTGTFHELYRLDGPEDKARFCRSMGVETVKTIY